MQAKRVTEIVATFAPGAKPTEKKPLTHGRIRSQAGGYAALARMVAELPSSVCAELWRCMTPEAARKTRAQMALASRSEAPVLPHPVTVTKKLAASVNPLLELRHPIAFDAIHPEHVQPAMKELLHQAREGLADIEAERRIPTYENTLGALEAVMEPVHRAMTVVAHLVSVARTPEMSEAHEAVEADYTALVSRIPLSERLYQRLSCFAGTLEAAALDDTRKRHLTLTLEDFVRAGARLEPAKKARLLEIDQALAAQTTQFRANVQDATNAFELLVQDPARLEGLPEGAVAAARESARAKGVEGYRFTLQAPSVLPALTYLKDAGLRETLYRAFHGRGTAEAHDNRALVDEILALRAEKAALLGYDSFVDLVTANRMAGSGQAARAFLDDLRARTEPTFARENAELQAFRREVEGPDAPPLAPWDVGYYAEKMRVARFDVDQETLRPYFALPNVLEGMFEVVRQLYGVQVQPVDLPVWHDEVYTFRILDHTGTEVCSFYLDPYPREAKRGGAWMEAFVTGGPREDGGFSPHVGLMAANVTRPSVGKPALLTHREVETMFHEFGHLLHHALSRVAVKSLAGTNVAWDFVELPSQLMENFCWEPESLALFASHHETGEPMPRELIDKMRRARAYRGANAMMRQLSFGLADLTLHMSHDPARDGSAVEHGRRVMSEVSPVPLLEDHGMMAAFTHLFGSPVGYAGGYYSYKWAERLDADAFGKFRTEGVLSRRVGDAFRSKLLARGNSQAPLALFVAFMGREPSIQPLLERAGIT